MHTTEGISVSVLKFRLCFVSLFPCPRTARSRGALATAPQEKRGTTQRASRTSGPGVQRWVAAIVESTMPCAKFVFFPRASTEGRIGPDRSTSPHGGGDHLSETTFLFGKLEKKTNRQCFAVTGTKWGRSEYRVCFTHALSGTVIVFMAGPPSLPGSPSTNTRIGGAFSFRLFK